MKRIISVLCLLLLVSTVQAQDKQRQGLEGNGKKVTREVPVQSFSALKVSGVFELRLSQGNTEKVTIEADENLQEYFTVANKGAKLEIDMDKIKNRNLKGKLHLVVHVTFKQLNELDLEMVGSIRSEEPLTFNNLKISNQSVGNLDLKLTADQFTLRNESVGNVNLSGKATNAHITNNGVGALKAGDFVVQTVTIENEGVGHAEVNAVKDLKMKESFLGKVNNKGAAQVKRTNKTVI